MKFITGIPGLLVIITQVGLLDIANKTIELPVKFEFWIINKYFFSISGFHAILRTYFY